ncbi:MAG: outer membrane protein assembly factor BamA [Nitrospira sp.]|nr:outer membrane protein assembly factor BamA [Nitrospira sp.]
MIIKRHYLLIAFFTLFLFTGFVFTDSALAADPDIKMIEVIGTSKISPATVQSKIKSRIGTTYYKNVLQDDIRKLYSLGYFDDIRVDAVSFEGGIKLIITVTEKPIIASLDFQGNKEIEKKDLLEKITIATGAFANYSLISDNIKMLVAFYHSEGYYLVNIIPVLRTINDHSVALTLQISEGPKVTIKSISLKGNSALTEKQIKKVMKTKKRWLLSFFTGSGIYQKSQVWQDIELIRELYHNNGYLRVAIAEPEITLSEDRENMHLTITISEGEQYNFGKFTLAGNTLFTENEIFSQLTISSGETFNRKTLKDDIENIVELYMENGYAMADIEPQLKMTADSKDADIHFNFSEGGIFKIARINIKGNTKTRDKVIRREVRLDEGDTYNKKLIKRSEQRINNLNFFEKIDIVPTPGQEELTMDMDITVEEKMTGMLSFGGGYSSVDKFSVMGEITQANLFGKGLFLKVRADLSARRANYNISIREPWFMDKPVSATFSLYNEEVEFPEYDKRATGGAVGFGKDFSEYTGGSITYRLESAEITSVADAASLIIKDQRGHKITSSITPMVWKDTRNNFLDPNKGERHTFTFTLAGLGGDNYFTKTIADSVWYFPTPLNTTFSIRGRVGYAYGFNGERLPLYERFYVGGISTIRGLGFGEGGPRNENGDKIGGHWQTLLNTEISFPLVEEIKLKGVVFIDVGGAFDKNEDVTASDFRRTAGFGFRWHSPFGPLRLEWGFNLDPKFDEGDNKIEFSVGGLL